MTSVSKRKWQILGVLGLPVNKKGQVLLTLRHAPQSKFWHNKWQIAGGEVEFGETLEQSLAREMHEELGISTRVLFPHPIVKSVVYKKGKHIDLSHDVHIILCCFIVDIGKQKISLDNDPEKETSSFQWYFPKQVDEIDCLPLTKEFVEEAEKIIKSNKLLK